MAIGGGVATLCLLLVLVNGARPDGRLHVTVLDIGQGDAILLQGPNGGRMLIDTGPDPDRLLTVLDARLPAWDRRLDLVVLTHPHEDHVAGLALLLDRYRVGEIVEPGMIGPGPGDAAYRRRLAELGRESRIVAAGDRLWLDGIRLDVAWPIRGTVPLRPADSGTAINNVSIVLDLRFGQRRMLFTGDVEEEIDPRLLAAGIAEADGSRPLDVLKVAHHGSGTATTDAFVERMAPRVAVVSAGWGNPYGHPSPKTVARLADTGAKLFRTDVDGSVEISTDGTDLVARADGGRPMPVRPSPTPARGVGFCPIPAQVGARRRPTYNRPDVDPIARRGGGHPARPPAERAAPDALCRSRGSVRVPVRGPFRAGRGDRHGARRGGRPAA
jgi:competence protein ComEC